MTSNGTASYVYDAENRLIATAGYSYIYDADGQRVEKCTEGSTPGTCASGATGTLYWRGLGSDTLRETDLAGNLQNNYIFFNGQRVARSDSAGTAHYYFSDHLGSHGVVENATGTVCEQDIDYYPYGGVENDYCPNAAQNYKFTGKERDGESGLDYFGARHHASALGRFMTPDPGGVKLKHLFDAQGLNRYAYTRNNPLTYLDQDGRDWEKAWQDLKVLASSFYSKVTLGAGIYGKGKVGSGEVKIGIAYKNTIKISAGDGGNPNISLKQSVEASAQASIGGAAIGKSVGSEQTVVAADTVGVTTRPGEDSWHSTGTGLSRGAGDVSANTSVDEKGVGVEEGAVLLGGVETGITAAGQGAWKDFLSNVHDEIVPPSPPPPPTPPPPPATSPKAGNSGEGSAGGDN